MSELLLILLDLDEIWKYKLYIVFLIPFLVYTTLDLTF